MIGLFLRQRRQIPLNHYDPAVLSGAAVDVRP